MQTAVPLARAQTRTVTKRSYGKIAELWPPFFVASAAVNAFVSVPVIGLASHEAGGAVELLGEHGAGQRMGPGLRSERQRLVGAGQDRRVEPVGAADDEG